MNVNKILTIVLYLGFTAAATDATMYGMVVDSARDSVLGGAKVLLTGKSTDWSDSTLTNDEGKFSFASMPVGTYLIQTSRDGYYTHEDLFVWADTDDSIKVLLTEVPPPPPPPRGTRHSGRVRGIWTPEGNPHEIEGRMAIDSLLYIAPGCTVVGLLDYAHTLNIDDTLKIGCPDSAPVFLDYVKLCKGGPNGMLIVNNCVFNNCKLFIDRIRSVSCSSAVFTGVQSELYIYTTDSLTLSDLSYYLEDPSIQLGCAGAAVKISNSDFPRSTISLYNTNSFESDYSWFGEVWMSTGSGLFDHCTIGRVNKNYYITNSIIGDLTLCGNDCGKLQYTSNISNSIIYGEISSPVYGFLDYNRINGNGDSCDTWFNMKCDPQFVDYGQKHLMATSPAIGAASDGKHIGYCQVVGEDVQVRSGPAFPKKVAEHFTISRTGSNVSIDLRNIRIGETVDAAVYSVQGHRVYTTQSQKNTGRILWNAAHLMPGVYLVQVHDGKRRFTGTYLHR